MHVISVYFCLNVCKYTIRLHDFTVRCIQVESINRTQSLDGTFNVVCKTCYVHCTAHTDCTPKAKSKILLHGPVLRSVITTLNGRLCPLLNEELWVVT